MTQQSLPSVFQGNGGIRFKEINGEFCLSAEDIGKGLGYEFPEESINKIVQRHFDEIEPYRVKVNLTFYYTEEGIYIISMLARTDKAKEFRQKVAMLLKQLRQQKIAIASRKAIQGYISTMNMLEKKRRNRKWIHRLIYYKKLGLNNIETAKLLDVSRDTVRRYEWILKNHGLWEVL